MGQQLETKFSEWAVQWQLWDWGGQRDVDRKLLPSWVQGPKGLLSSEHHFPSEEPWCCQLCLQQPTPSGSLTLLQPLLLSLQLPLLPGQQLQVVEADVL